MSATDTLLEGLGVLDRDGRLEALRRLAAGDSAFPPCGSNVNMHLHSFFSYNSAGYSPCHIAWRARQEGLYAAAICDFDVLDGMGEFAEAGLILGLRTAVHLEARTYVSALCQTDINSPGEAGVAYIMGAGFAKSFPEGTEQTRTLTSFRERARERNLALIDRINAHLPELALDYERDVLPLTPSGNATERHIISAYVDQAQKALGAGEGLYAFWERVLGKDRGEVGALLADRPALEEVARSRLVKRGGLGYAAPTETTFPSVDDYIGWVLSCRAIPVVAWLDGTGEGEEDPEALLDLFTSKGCATANIIPDRSWNLPDTADRDRKRANFDAFVRAADRRGLPINIGTEMNKRGLPFVDELDGEVLGAYREIFLRGARIMVGQSILLRHADFSYVDEAAGTAFGSLEEKNGFFEAVGALPPLDRSTAGALVERGSERAHAAIQDSVGSGRWTVR